MALSWLAITFFCLASGSSPLTAHPVDTQNLLRGGSLDSKDPYSLISPKTPLYSSAPPAFQTQPLNLSYITVTARIVSTVTELHYRTCTKVVPGTPPCRKFVTASSDTRAGSSVTSTSLRPSLLMTPQVQHFLKNISSFSNPAKVLLQPTREEADYSLKAESQIPKLVERMNLLGEGAKLNTRHGLQPTFQGAPNDRDLLKSHRTPRLITGPTNIVITKSVTEILTSTVTVTDSQTTVAITYGGCVPPAAVTATACSS